MYRYKFAPWHHWKEARRTVSVLALQLLSGSKQSSHKSLVMISKKNPCRYVGFVSHSLAWSGWSASVAN
jgi:hypothetical protein